ncbi:chemotaxis protein, partial [Methylophilus sp. 3sh_L]
ISAASTEQTTGIDQVNQAVTSMDETTQQNAALVEEAAAAAESLVDQANQLTEAISQFKLDGMASGAHSVKHKQPSRPGNGRAQAQVNHRPASGAGSWSHANTPRFDLPLKTGTHDHGWETF